MTLNIGHIEYANCTPIFSALAANFDCSGYRFLGGVPSRLNAMLREGALDLSPSSSFEYAEAHDQYCLFPELSISSLGQVKSVLLFSRVPIEELDGCRIGLSAESDTSVNLLKVLLAKKHGFSNSYERTSLSLPEVLERFPAALLIGDAALKGVDAGIYRSYDLGELWREFTGLPFVFALWIVRRDSALVKHDELAALGRDLIAAKNIACASYPEIAATYREREWLSVSDLVDYWNTISYDLTPAHLEGVRCFFQYAFEMGLIPTLPVIRFFGEEC